jgi:hypothetical protein
LVLTARVLSKVSRSHTLLTRMPALFTCGATREAFQRVSVQSACRAGCCCWGMTVQAAHSHATF